MGGYGATGATTGSLSRHLSGEHSGSSGWSSKAHVHPNFLELRHGEVRLTIILGSSYTRCCIAGSHRPLRASLRPSAPRGPGLSAGLPPSLLAFHWAGGSKGGKGCSGGGTSRKKLRRKARKSRGLCRGKKRPLSYSFSN